MASKQQLRLLFVYVLAFGLLTVPVILILIYLVPSEDTNTVSAAVIENKPKLGTYINQIDPTDDSRVTATSSKKIPSQTNLHAESKTTDHVENTAMPRSFIAGNWVVVDCERRIVLQCPHRLINHGTSSRFGRPNEVFQSHCRDINIKLDSFCVL